jgi:Alpha-kinase family.
MQATSHFSVHISNAGQHLLRDLQGVVYNDGVVLTDPVVISMEGGKYGPIDLGTNGISTLFAHHNCNEFCRSQWRKLRERYKISMFRRDLPVHP